MPKSLPPSRQHKRPSASAWLFRSVAGLLGKRAKTPPAPEKAKGTGKPVAPTKAETALLQPFSGLSPDRIHVPKTKAECEAAVDEILAAGVAGFDTEAKPTFRVGEKSGGPHVVQFALTDKAFIFQLHRRDCQKVVAGLIESERVLKVGFGLKNDHGQIRNRLGVKPNAILDLDHVFRKRGYPRQIGVRAAMGAVLNLSFPKSKSTTTSNWAATELTTRQLCYAANDAFAALKIMEALDLKPAEISGHHHR
ncbi:MAG: 3'-5' exonuclease [Terrimicrobiaceae bacterium]